MVRCILLGLLVAGCAGSIGGGNDDEPGGGGASGGSTGTSGGTGGSGVVSMPSSACAKTGVVPGPAPVVRLTNTEYRNSVRDLLPRVTMPAAGLGLPAEVATQGFLNNAQTQTPSAEVIENVHDNAQTVARAAVADLTKVLPCKPASAADEPACGKQFIQSFGKQAFRRPMTDQELARYNAFFTDAYGKWGFPTSIRMVIEAFLQSPSFLYRLEPGLAPLTGGKVAPLGPYELASRLSYLLTDTMPDAMLMAAADGGKLATPAGLEAEARRLLADARARPAIAAFNAQWLRFDAMDSLVKSPDLYPKFNTAMAASMKDAAVRYVDRIFWDEGRTVDALLGDGHAFVDAALAPIYGVPAPTAMSWVKVDDTQRAGVMTQAGLLAGFAHERTSAPVLRGVLVLDRLLCASPPAPPAGVNTNLPELGPMAKLTTRQQLEMSHRAPECAACHRAIDGVGFGFENFDAVGQWRTTEFGLPVDAHGEIVGTPDANGTFNGAVELARKLGKSQSLRQCLVRHWMAYTFAVTREEVDACAADPVARALSSNGDFREMLVSLVKSDAFRHRPVTP
jgi:hypothetical protein